MATRPPRHREPHTYFHVMSRGTNRWNIYLDDVDRLRFVKLLAKVCKRTGIRAHAYCLMGNHFHLVLYCPDPVLSEAMRDLKSRYAKYYNQRHQGTGSVFEAPFVEVPVLTDEHLVAEIRYVHRNPLDLDPTLDLAAYRWSSHGEYLGLRAKQPFLDTRIGLELFGPDYRLQVERPWSTDKIQNAVRPTTFSVHSPGECTLRQSELSLAGILRAVASAAQRDVGDVTPRRRNGLIGLAIMIGFQYGGFTAAEMAEPFGYKSSNAVHMAGRRARDQVAAESELEKVYRSAVNRLAIAA